MGRTVGRGLAPSKRAASPVKLPAPCPPQVGTVFSLGSALFDWPLAFGYHASRYPVPSAWSESFIGSADGGTYWGLFTSCGAGRDWVLCTAKGAKLTLRITNTMSDAEWERQLAAIKAALVTRGALPTRLHVINVSQSGDQLLARLARIPVALQGCGHGITEIHTQDCGYGQGEFLCKMAAVCPNATFLYLSVLPTTLPPPSSLPCLTRFTVASRGAHSDVQAASMMAPFLPQVQSLVLPYTNTPSWAHLFPQDTTAPHLTYLSANAILGHQLCGLLLERAPCLKRLRVARVELPESLRDKQWAVEQLTVTTYPWGYDPLTQWARLPTSLVKRTVLTADSSEHPHFKIAGPEGVDAVIAERLCEWRIAFQRFTVSPADTLAAGDQTVALRNTLRQFGDLQTSDGAVVTLSEWQWSADTVQVAAEALPALAHLTFGLHTPEPLTDELLRHVVSIGPRMRNLTVDSLSLQSSHHKISWPWDRLSIRTVDVTQLTKLPNPRGSKWTRCVEACYVKLEAVASISEAALKKLTDWLWCAWWLKGWHSPGYVCSPLGFNVYVEGIKEVKHMQSQLAVLKAFRVNQQVQEEARLTVRGCRMDPETMEQLQGLPGWGHHMTFDACEWPQAPAMTYKKMGHSMPTCFREWVLSPAPALEAVSAVCRGADKRRFGLGLDALRVYATTYKGKESEEIGPHVWLHRWRTGEDEEEDEEGEEEDEEGEGGEEEGDGEEGDGEEDGEEGEGED